jgi:outer membrane protein assembly factor BamD
MLRTKLSVVCALLLVTGALLMGGCSTAPLDKTASMSPEQIYAEAQDELKVGAYDKAISLLEKLEGRAAGTPLAQQAELDKAYAMFKSEQPAQALATLDRFIKLHPASPALDYALYFKGLVNFNDDLGLFSSITRQDLAERDQLAAKESFASFKELVTRFPASHYTPDARLRMAYIINSLAQYEVHVARYYYSRSAYLAAINRAQSAVADYREAPAREEALYILYRAYDSLDMPKLRDDAKRILELNYPDSDFLVHGFKAKSKPWWMFW